MPRGFVSFFSMSKSPQVWRGTGERKIPSPLRMQRCDTPEATPWPGPKSKINPIRYRGLYPVFWSGKAYLEIPERVLELAEGQEPAGAWWKGMTKEAPQKGQVFSP